MKWSPGIKDGTFISWLAVGIYTLACLLSIGVARRESCRHISLPRHRIFWTLVILFLAFLALNKQLDLQTGFTELLRGISKHEGWYEARRGIQRLFVIGMIGGAILALFTLLILIRRSFWRLLPIAFGMTLLVSFLLIRSASFHHMDLFLPTSVFGIKLYILLELGGGVVVLMGAFFNFLILKDSSLKDSSQKGHSAWRSSRS